MSSTRPPSLPTELLEAFRQLPPATISAVLEEGFVDGEIRPIWRRVAVVGIAATVRLEDGDPATLGLAIERLRAGDVLVIDNGGNTRVACWGELTSLAARAHGCAGVIVDGAVTNVLEVEEHGMPTFARGVSARLARPTGADGGGVGVAVQCGGVAVHAGDLVVADDNGIVVIPPERAAEVALRARAVEDGAPHARIWLHRGGSYAELAGRSASEIRRMLAERGWA